MCQDLETSSDLADNLLRGLSLPAVKATSSDTLLEAVEDGGGRKEAGWLVGEVVIQTGVTDDGLCHPPELLHVHSQGQVEPGQHVIQVVQGRARAQLPAQLREDQQLPLLEK